jgi:hypothetical protein
VEHAEERSCAFSPSGAALAALASFFAGLAGFLFTAGTLGGFAAFDLVNLLGDFFGDLAGDFFATFFTVFAGVLFTSAGFSSLGIQISPVSTIAAQSVTKYTHNGGGAADHIAAVVHRFRSAWHP